MNITLDDLFETCEACGGSGKAQQETVNPDSGTLGRKPVVSVTGSDNDCDACGGYGRGNLTQTGQALLDFLRILKRRTMI